ncbi:phosphate:acyl-[acyl carrier protein] acyltransferase [Pseudidiomarina planktonica]|uniref:Phosphate acyltransferase n=1 Tax=Pseudidiomarina planktonica TaxID=1323738 RepID=A0A1Y6ESA0_9GAMM|nr:phosphate acyltransferase PlsX [Pseudidiomarina planktonica]RUO65340.1 phosphate acyltransferase PlsX [Pseudidiomarina planktonica]SMQ65417.1 phosphate:acyl-[acyl carrier protein] acyltransferase [Pseudidiomarina planktonica]
MADLTLALDAMGGDSGPSVVVGALSRALDAFPKVKFVLVGEQQELQALLNQHNLNEHPRVRIQHASQTVTMTDKPGYSLRAKPDSSMRVALDLLAEGSVSACVSAGNTGALMTTAYFTLKTLPGVLRPALMSALPNNNGGHGLILDLGANPVCDSDTLFQFGVMGAVAAEARQLGKRPRVALLNMGEEDIKGNDAVKGAAQLFQQSPHINYIGFIEGDDLFSGKADVIVCDGFVGNVALKSCEGLAELLLNNIRQSIAKHWASRLFAKLFYRRLSQSWEWLKPDHYNGASLVGLRGVVIKSHGDANERAFFSAIEQAVIEAQEDLPSRIRDRVETVLLEQQ